MTGPDGPLLAEALTSVLSGIEITPPQREPWDTLFQALQEWNATRAQHGLPPIEEIGSLAGVLALSLDIEGWCLSDQHAGHVLAFAASELELVVAEFFDRT